MTQSVFFQKIEEHWKLDRPFVVYKKPNEAKLTAQLQQTVSLPKENFKEEGFLFAPFTKENHSTIWFSKKEAILLEVEFEFSKSFIEKKVLNEVEALSRLKHIETVEKSLELLKKNELQKVVISRKEVVSIRESKPLHFFKEMCSLYSNTFCYCWYHPKVGMWIGATPETLVTLSKNSFETMALAGTMPFKGTHKVVWGNKEKEEQQFVTDSILEELSSVTKNIKIGETITQKAGDLLHLKTPISGELNSTKGLISLIDLLHPTPAVCGLPKQSAQDFILANEGYDRKYYTGFLGEVKPGGNSQLFVNLRCMELNKNQAIIYVGGGITSHSDPDKEWEETINKSQIMKRIL